MYLIPDCNAVLNNRGLKVNGDGKVNINFFNMEGLGASGLHPVTQWALKRNVLSWMPR